MSCMRQRTLTQSFIYFARFNECHASFVPACYSALEYYELFSRVKMSIKSSFVIAQGRHSITITVIVLSCFNAKTIFGKNAGRFS